MSNLWISVRNIPVITNIGFDMPILCYIGRHILLQILFLILAGCVCLIYNLLQNSNGRMDVPLLPLLFLRMCNSCRNPP